MGERADEMREYTSPGNPDYTTFSQRDVTSGLSGSDTANYDASSPDDSEEVQAGMLQEDIEQTRAEMARTVDEIQERLTPQNIVEQVKETAKDTATEAIDNVKNSVREATVGRVENMVNNVSDSARETGSGLIGLIKENPVPAALAGLGLGWLYMKSQDKSGQDNSQRSYATSSGYYTSYPYTMSGDNSAPNYRSTNSNSGLMGKIKDNPIPAAIAGASIGYMFMKGQGQSSSSGYSTYAGQNSSGYSTYTGQNSSQGLDQVKGKVGDVVDTAGQKAGDIASGAGDMASQVTHKAGEIAGGTADMAGNVAGNVVGGVQQGAQQATNQLERMLHENPLAVGGVALVLGAVIGMMLPATEKENQIMGKAHDTLMEKAGETVQQTMDKVSNVAGEVTNTAKEEAKNQGLTK